jgi:glyoxylase-like metal-dependent hydrolase (beta-lactamase superfamily II)
MLTQLRSLPRPIALGSPVCDRPFGESCGFIYGQSVSIGVAVADVGAGYTTVLAGRDTRAIVDFGARREHVALDGFDRLWDFDGHHRHFLWNHCQGWLFWYRPSNAIVISHPHRDHYRGLLGYANRRARGDAALLESGSEFFHPRIPDNTEARELLLRLAALDQVLSGVPEYQLGWAVGQSCDGPVERLPLAAGMQVQIADHEIDVLWPPLDLDSTSGARLAGLVRAYDDLARVAAEENDPRLREALEQVRERGPADALYSIPEERQRERDTPSREIDDDGDVLEGRVNAQMQKLRLAITRGANCLSLAFATTDRRYVFLGDLDRALHPAIAPLLADYEPVVVVSAHHGTHFDPSLAQLRSRYVISSVGPPLSANVRSEYATMGMHLRTDQAGDIAVWVDGRNANVVTCDCHKDR